MCFCRPCISSLCLAGDDDEEESGEERLPSCFDYIMHFLTVFWKVLFAFVPPTEYWNGWACFFVSISLIGVLTAVTGDLASHFGCTIGLKDSVTAVVFVALGTSVPGVCLCVCMRCLSALTLNLSWVSLEGLPCAVEAAVGGDMFNLCLLLRCQRE